jgi:hypothetical protein
MVGAALVAAVEYATLRRSQRFSARFWRSIGFGRRSSREHATEGIYVVSVVAGVVVLVVAILTAL